MLLRMTCSLETLVFHLTGKTRGCRWNNHLSRREREHSLSELHSFSLFQRRLLNRSPFQYLCIKLRKNWMDIANTNSPWRSHAVRTLSLLFLRPLFLFRIVLCQHFIAILIISFLVQQVNSILSHVSDMQAIRLYSTESQAFWLARKEDEFFDFEVHSIYFWSFESVSVSLRKFQNLLSNRGLQDYNKAEQSKSRRGGSLLTELIFVPRYVTLGKISSDQGTPLRCAELCIAEWSV